MAAAHLKQEEGQEEASLLIPLAASAFIALMGLMFLRRRQQNSASN